ncbi:MAG TPA: pitrilysin family protein [Pyrinomonadaceae bacterium]|jgi:zinc protease|nr:pitrilysin family protein [Pyrinomonadaceae bacterium]
MTANQNENNLARRAAAWALSLALVALSFLPAAAQQTGAEAERVPARVPAAADPTDLTKLVTEFETGGLKVLVKRREKSQSVVAGLFLRGGARNVTAENAGVEALMLDVATEASANFPRERMRRELSRTGTSISYGLNYDYSVLTLASTRRHFDRAWEIFSDAALRPSFTPDDFERVKNRLVVSRSDDADTPDSFLQLLQSKVAYAGHPYLNDPRGTAESVARLTVDDVRRYHQQVMQTSRLLLVVVGDVDPQQIRQKVEGTLAKLPRGDYKPSPLPQLTFAAPSVAVTQRELPTNYVQGIFAAPPLTSDDIYAMRVASAILQNRVFVEVRVRRNLSYAPDAFLGSQGANTGGIYVTAVDANQAVRVMLDEIAKLQSVPVSADELKATAQQFLTRHYLAQETNAAQAGELAQYELIGGGWRNAGGFIERLRGVSSQDVARVTRTYMRNLQFVVIGNPRSVDKSVFTGQAAGE